MGRVGRGARRRLRLRSQGGIHMQFVVSKFAPRRGWASALCLLALIAAPMARGSDDEKGACCYPYKNSTKCEAKKPEDCDKKGGTYFGNNTVCSAVSCEGSSKGACCPKAEKVI